jgi:hypothetical protein
MRLCAGRAGIILDILHVWPPLDKRVGRSGRSTPSLPSNARWNGCRGAGPCQALAAEGGGRKARLYKGPSVSGCDRHRRTDGLKVKTRRSRQASCRALYHPFEFQKSPCLRDGPPDHSANIGSSRSKHESHFVSGNYDRLRIAISQNMFLSKEKPQTRQSSCTINSFTAWTTP